MSRSRSLNKEGLEPTTIPVSSDPRYSAEAGNLCHGAEHTYPSGPRVTETEDKYGKKVEPLQAQLLLPTKEVNQWISMHVSVPECRNILQFYFLSYSGFSASHLEDFSLFKRMLN